MASSTKGSRIGGGGRTAEIDGAYFGGHVSPENLAVDRIDRRLVENRSDKRQVVVAMRERGGSTLAQVFRAEADATATIRLRIAKGTTIHADESPAWNPLHAAFAMQRINHQDGYSVDGACTNGAKTTSSGCAAVNSGTTTTSPGHISSVMPRRRLGVRTCAASATASRRMASSDWPCGAGRRLIFPAIGNVPTPPRPAAS